jgi:threonine 3-dehydrogenase
MINGGKIAMLGISGKSVALNWDKMASLVNSGLNIEPVITQVLPLSKYITGFELMKSGQCGKVILEW